MSILVMGASLQARGDRGAGVPGRLRQEAAFFPEEDPKSEL